VDELFSILHGHILSENNSLPRNYYAAKTMTKKLGLGYNTINACESGCVLFRGEHTNETNTRRKIEINDSINDSFLSLLGLKLPINDSNNVFGFELLSMSRLCHLSRLCRRGFFSSKG
jgi:hypothetical protein